MSDPTHVWPLRQIEDPSESNGYFLEVIEAPPGTGVHAAKVWEGENICDDAILRNSIDECDGMPFFIYFIDSGFTPPVSYLLRWHGAGVANQSFTPDVTINTQDKGVLDGSLIPRGTAPAVASNKLTGTGNTAANFYDPTNRTVVRGMSAIMKYVMGSSSAYATLLAAHWRNNFFGLDGYTIFTSWTNTLRLTNAAAPHIVVPRADTVGHFMVVRGGFNASGEPWNGSDAGFEYGAFMLHRTDGGVWVLQYMYAVSGLVNLDTNNYWVTGVGQHGGAQNIEEFAVPDADLSSLLVPLAMDTFTGANGTVVGGKALEAGAFTWVHDPRGEAGTATIESNVLRLEGATEAWHIAGQMAPTLTVDFGVSNFIMRFKFKFATSAGRNGVDAALRYLDVNNLVYVRSDSTTVRIVEKIAGAFSTRVTGAYDPPDGSPYVIIMDGSTIHLVLNNTETLTYSSLNAVYLNTTKHGLATGLTLGNYVEFDDFSIYPRRSTTQYDDAIQPYVDGITTAPATTPES